MCVWGEVVLAESIPKEKLFPYVGWISGVKQEVVMKKIFLGMTTLSGTAMPSVLGIEYTLPMLLKVDARLDSKGRFRLYLGREDITASPRMRRGFMVNSDQEYMTGPEICGSKTFFCIYALRQ